MFYDGGGCGGDDDDGDDEEDGGDGDDEDDDDTCNNNNNINYCNDNKFYSIPDTCIYFSGIIVVVSLLWLL